MVPFHKSCCFSGFGFVWFGFSGFLSLAVRYFPGLGLPYQDPEVL
jgi:hypothetical protein